MRNIINLLYRYHAVMLFIVLEVAAFSLYLTYNSYQRASYFNSSAVVVGGLKDMTNSITAPFEALSENETLRKENAKLLNNQLKNLYHAENHKVIVNDTMYEQQYVYLPGQVIDNSYARQKNYVVLNVGTNKGVSKEMGVIGPDGIIGFVKDVSARYALVIPVLHNSFSTPVRLNNSHHFGFISWDGADPGVAQLQDLSNTVPIEVGDSVVTKAASGRFPDGILVGTIKDFKKVTGQPYYQIDLDLSTDFTNLNHAYVVTNFFRAELDDLTKSIHD